MIRLLMAFIRFPLGPDWNARLEEDVERRRNSYAVQDYRRRRAAALKATRG